VMIQLKEEDLIEANANAYQQKTKNQQWKIGVGLMGWIFFFLLVAGLWAIFSNRGNPATPQPEPAKPVLDVTMVVLPSAVAAIWILLGLSVSLLMQVQVIRSRTPFGKAAYKKIKASGWMGALMLVAIAALVSPQFVPVIEWRGGRFFALFLAFVPWFIALFVLLPILRLFNRAVVRSHWTMNVSLHGPIELKLDDAKVVSRSANIETTYRWSGFLRFRETANLFVLVTENAEFMMVPKRDLDSQGVMMEFRALIQTHIAEGYFLTVPDAAFPVLRPASLPPPPLERMEMRQG